MSRKYNQSIPFPLDNYIVRCTEETFGRSSKDNPMITLKFEIDSPEEVEIAGEKVTVAGTQTQPMWITTQVSEDGVLDVEKTKNAVERAKEFYNTCGMELGDTENPTLGFKGKLFHAQIYGKEEERRKAPTAEQKAKNQQGDILKNPITGKPEIRYQAVIAKIYGPAEGNPNKPY